MRLSKPRHETRLPASGRHPASTTAGAPNATRLSASAFELAPMSTGASARSFGATLSRSFGPIKCGGRTPKTPFTGPLRPWMTTRSPATVGIVTPPFGIR